METESQPNPNQVVFGPQGGPQTEFLRTSADIAIYGGARGGGKSYALLLEPLRHINVSTFTATIFRRTFTQIEQAGGLWDTSVLIYPYAKGKPFGGYNWKFPSGMTICFRHMEHPEDRYAWLGAQVPMIGFDELATFTEEQFFFMFSSNRSTCGVAPYIRCTTNPDNRSWVSKFIQWWWDETTGYPIQERSGKLRYFIRYKDQIIWADTKEELKKEYPDLLPKSVTFIAANVFDNKVLLDKDPSYISSLMALPTVERERFLKGNWKITEGGSIMFRREWFRIIPEMPHDIRRFVRFWDLAATEPEGSKDPDWTAGVLMGERNGQFFICDVQRFRGRPHAVEQRIVQCAQTDPTGTAIRMEQEPGASGVALVDHYARHILVGYDFKGVKAQRNKVIRANPLSAAAESGNVYLVRNPTWNNTFLDEVENFKGEDEKNDQVDAAAAAQNELKAALGDWKFAVPVSTSRYRNLIDGKPGRYEKIGFL